MAHLDNNNVHLSYAHQHLSAHMIHIYLNTIFYTHIEHSPTKTIYIRYYMKTHTDTHTVTHTHTHTHTDCSRNWELILVGVEILWQEEGFQFAFKRWQAWAVSTVLWECNAEIVVAVRVALGIVPHHPTPSAHLQGSWSPPAHTPTHTVRQLSIKQVR